MAEYTDRKEEQERRLRQMRLAEDTISFSEALRLYILFRLNVPDETKERLIYRLVVFSVKLKMPGIDAKRLEERLATMDCHQTSYVVSKKTLLMMEIERELAVRLSPEALSKVETLEEYAKVLWEAMKR